VKSTLFLLQCADQSSSNLLYQQNLKTLRRFLVQFDDRFNDLFKRYRANVSEIFVEGRGLEILWEKFVVVYGQEVCDSFESVVVHFEAFVIFRKRPRKKNLTLPQRMLVSKRISRRTLPRQMYSILSNTWCVSWMSWVLVCLAFCIDVISFFITSPYSFSFTGCRWTKEEENTIDWIENKRKATSQANEYRAGIDNLRFSFSLSH
jgi:hypothetical protein